MQTALTKNKKCMDCLNEHGEADASTSGGRPFHCANCPGIKTESSYNSHKYIVLLKSIAARREPGVHSAVMFFLTLVALTH